MTKMTYAFDMSANSFYGTLPTQMGQMTKMKLLFSLNKLIYVSKNDNSFSGLLPTELGRMTAMESHFYLHANEFTGSLPTQLGLMTNISNDFYLYENEFTGALPTQLGLNMLHAHLPTKEGTCSTKKGAAV